MDIHFSHLNQQNWRFHIPLNILEQGTKKDEGLDAKSFKHLEGGTGTDQVDPSN